MLWLPQKGDRRVQHNVGTVGDGTPGTDVTTGGSASTKGAIAELIASSNFDAFEVIVMACNYGVNGSASEGSLDILHGASGQEAVLIPDLLMGYCGSLNPASAGPKVWKFPLYVPAGTRLSAQAAGVRLSTAIQVGIWLIGGDGNQRGRCGQKVTTYGMGTVPNGTAITPGASGAEGAWTQIVASTTEDHFALVPSFQISADISVNARGIAVDLGIGAAAGEVELAGQYLYYYTASEIMGGPVMCEPYYGSIPAGSRLAMRVGNEGTNESGYNGVIHCVS